MADNQVQQKQSVPFRDLVLMMVCQMRNYDRNQSFFASIFLLGLGYLFVAASVWFYQVCYFIPEAIFIAVFMIAMLAWMPVRYANLMKFGAYFNIAMASLGWVCHWEFGLSVFGSHFETLAYVAIIAGGILGLMRRFWNAFIWRQHDRLVRQYNFSKVRT